MKTLLQDLVADQAETRPNAAAIEADGASITYADLERQSNQIARLLREHGCRRGDRVCVLSPMTLRSIVVMLGIYKADAIYVPIDPSAPAVAAIVRASQPATVLTTGPTARLVESLVRAGDIGAATVIGSIERTPIAGESFFTQFCLADAAAVSDRSVASRNRPTNPACLLFSPARTLEPVGAVIAHSALVRSTEWATAHFDVSAGDRLAGTSRADQDRSVFETMSALAGGATFLPLPHGSATQARRLGSFLRRSRLTVWSAPVEALALLANADLVAPGDFPMLRQVLCWGSGAPGDVLRYWLTRVGHASFTSLYGSAETAVAAHYRWRRERTPECESSPVGVPCPGQELLVLDQRLERVEAGTVGDLWVGGVGVSAGYWGEPRATAERFRRGREGAGGTGRIWRTGDRGRYGTDGQVYLDHSRPAPALMDGHLAATLVPAKKSCAQV